MLNEWLQVVYKQELQKTASAEMDALVSKLPIEELKKLADGTPVAKLYAHLEKTAFNPSIDGEPASFLERFKGTPLFEQAVALEQEELQAEMQNMQERQARRADQANADMIWDKRDQIRLRKRLLELDLAKQDAGAVAPQSPDAQGAGAPGPVPAEGVQDNSQGLQGGVAKVGMGKEGSADSTKAPTDEEKFAWADSLGRELARNDMRKAANVQMLRAFGDAAGRAFAKTAGIGDMEALLSKAAPMARKALGFAKSNPALAGAALGAGAGAVAGGPGHRLSGAAGGAALGASAGGLAKSHGLLTPGGHADLGKIMPPVAPAQRVLSPPNVADFAPAGGGGLMSRMRRFMGP
jgi:hypothetical protein